MYHHNTDFIFYCCKKFNLFLYYGVNKLLGALAYKQLRILKRKISICRGVEKTPLGINEI